MLEPFVWLSSIASFFQLLSVVIIKHPPPHRGQCKGHPGFGLSWLLLWILGSVGMGMCEHTGLNRMPPLPTTSPTFITWQWLLCHRSGHRVWPQQHADVPPVHPHTLAYWQLPKLSTWLMNPPVLTIKEALLDVMQERSFEPCWWRKTVKTLLKLCMCKKAHDFERALINFSSYVEDIHTHGHYIFYRFNIL